MGTKSYLTLADYSVSSSGSMFVNSSSNPHGSTVSYFQGAMELLEWEFAIEQEGSQDGGKPRSVERVKHGEFKIKRQMDSRSPKLFYYCCSATFLNQAQLSVFSVNSTAFLTITMSWVHVSSYEPKGGEGVPTEEVGFRYGEMNVKWNDNGMGGENFGFPSSLNGSIDTSWSWVFETPSQINPHLPEITT